MDDKFRSTFRPGSYNLGLKNSQDFKYSEKSGSQFQRSGDTFKQSFQFGKYARENIMSPKGSSKANSKLNITRQSIKQTASPNPLDRSPFNKAMKANTSFEVPSLNLITSNTAENLKTEKKVEPKFVPKSCFQRVGTTETTNDKVVKTPLNGLASTHSNFKNRFANSSIPTKLGHNTGEIKIQTGFKNLNAVDSIASYTNANITPEKRKTSINGQITEWGIKKRLSSNEHEKLNQTVNATFLSIKAQNVSNKSVQRYMKNLKYIQESGGKDSRESSPYADAITKPEKNYSRYDQSP